jgi:hypothetical protein
MFKPSRYIRICSLMITLVTLAGCAEEGSLVGLDEEGSLPAADASPALARGGNGGGNGGGGNGGGGNGGGDDGDSAAPLIEDFDLWDPSAWVPGDHPLGKGWFDPDNVSHGSSALLLTLPAGTYDGAEIRSASRVQFRNVEVRLRTPDAPGSISAFFLYEFVRRRNDEIDIEILNDGSREILFTTWVAGKQTNHVRRTLLFDPTVEFHDYRIEWSRGRVRFLVDGVLMQEWTEGIPRDAMYVMSNAWWPTWLNGPELKDPGRHEIDRIIY